MQPRDDIGRAAGERLKNLQQGQQVPPIISQAGPPPLPRSTPPPLPPSARSSAAPTRLAGPLGVSKPEPLLTPEELDRFKNLLVFAKSTVEGYFSGKHKSPFRGSSAEFADYKEYVPGDDISHMDWRVYGRSRRLFVRQFEEETDMVMYMLVDTSNSMRYAGGKRQSKYILAARIAAALTYLMIHQSDKVSIGLFADKLNTFIQPGGTRRHLHNIISALEKVSPQQTTGLAKALGECHAVFKKKGRLVILSDFLTDTAGLFDALGPFVHRKFEILLLQVLDPDEIDLPPVSVAKFVDMETGDEVQVEPEEIRRSYRANMLAFIDSLQREAELRQIRFSLVDTRNPYLHAIEAYLGFRGQNAGGG